MQLNAIPRNKKSALLKADLVGDRILGDCTSRQYYHLLNRFIKIKALLSRRRFFDLIADPVDNVSGAIGVPNDSVECFSYLAQVWRMYVKKIHGRPGVVARSGDRLLHFMCQRS